MHCRSLCPLFLAALGLSALTSCHISNRGVDFSPLTDRFEPAVDDEVVLEGDTTSISTPIATPPEVALNTTPASPPAPTVAAANAPAPHPAAPIATTAPVAAGGSYVVKAGDTLSAIARRNKCTVTQICTANGLQTTTPLKVGQKLRLPAAGSAVAAASAAKPNAVKPAAKTNGKARSHTIQSGETLYAIARKYGVTPAALMQANKLTPQTAGKLRIGSTLTIPAK